MSRHSIFAAALLLTPALRAEVIESKTSDFGRWEDASIWSPPRVPDNSASATFDVTVAGSVKLSSSRTISRLALTGSGNLRVEGHRLTILETTTNAAFIGLNDEDDHGISIADGGVSAGVLASHSDGRLSGTYRLFGGSAVNPTTLEFAGADVRELANGVLSLEGPFTRIVDEAARDGLRNFVRVGPGSRFNVNAREFTTPGDFTNDGTLNIGSLHAGDRTGLATSFSVAGTLTNFDAATGTLQSGSFRLGGRATDATLRFRGANIVNNAASIYLEGPLAQIVDENGDDALRRFAQNMAGAEFTTGKDFVTAGDFRNDGTLRMCDAQFRVTGQLLNFSSATRTLTGGKYSVRNQSLQFAGADIVHNAAAIVLSRPPGIVDEQGRNGLRNLAVNQNTGSFSIYAYPFTTPGDFTNEGEVIADAETSSYDEPIGGGDFIVPPGYRYTQTAGRTVVRGSVQAETISIDGGALMMDSGEVRGNVTIGDAVLAVSGYQPALYGNLKLTAPTRYRLAVSSAPPLFAVYGERTELDGTLEVDVTDNERPSNSYYWVITGTSGLSGAFRNAPPGSRIPTTDGKGSFLVNYNYTRGYVWLSDYKAVGVPAQLLNVSTRAKVLTGDNVVIGGFIVTGRDPKPVIVRGIGPSLSQAGVSGPLQDPTLALFDSKGTSVITNDNWRDTQATQIAGSGVAPGNEREAAAIATLAPGAYTVVLRGKDNGTGVGVVEAYDLARSVPSKVANVSTRAFVQTGSDVLIGGFIAGGHGEENADVIVRAIGPDLESSGVTNALQDPELELRDGDGTLVASNDDHANSADRAEISAAGLSPSDPRSSALRAKLPHGNYTAIVRGKSETSGVAVVEVYDLNG